MTDYSKRNRLPDAGMVSRIEKVAEAFDIPKEFLAGTLKVTVLGTSEVIIEGRLSVIEYTDTILRLATAGYILSITGCDFEVTELDRDFLKLVGKISSVSYIS